MNNFEYMVEKYGVEFIKRLLARDLGVNRFNNEPCSCRDLKCIECRFCHTDCEFTDKLSWLDSQRMTLYEEGDVVIAYDLDVLIVKKYDTPNRIILVNRLDEPCTTYVASFKDIKRKVGSINE